MSKILLVGELNPYGADPRFALYPRPRHASGNRLREILGLTDEEYLKGTSRCNLCTGAWSAKSAREAAAHILAEEPPGTCVVLCGAKVAKAFGVPYGGGYVVRCTDRGLRLLSIPHPSGLNRLWNDPEVAHAVRAAFLQLTVPPVPGV